MGSQSSQIERESVPAGPAHPYFPLNAELPSYSKNETPVHVLLGSFASMIGITLISTLLIARNKNRKLSLYDQAIFCWFILCGSLHCFFEGYFILNYSRLASLQTLPAQLWKEYALSDSRYLTSDPFTLSVETITVLLWGPICYGIALCIARGNHSLRYSLQIVVCTAHLYGVALYYATCEAEHHLRGISYSRPETQYYWVYYVGMNAPWAVVPLVILVGSIRSIRRAFGALDSIRDISRPFGAQARMESAIQSSEALKAGPEAKLKKSR